MSWLANLSFFKSSNETEDDEQEEDGEEPKKKVQNFEDMNTLEQKLFCKYRYSCYPNGVPPLISEETKFKSIKEIVKPMRIEIPLVLRCKYRKSCYETGVLPDINPQKSEELKKSKPKPVPTTVEELKLQCKYRKSCYINKAQQSSNEQDTPVAPIPTNLTETVAKPRPVAHNPAPASLPPHNIHVVPNPSSRHHKRRTAQPKSYSKQTKQEELPIPPTKETTKEFCDHQDDIKAEAEMAVKLQQKKDKKASIMAEKLLLVQPVVHDELEEPDDVEEIFELAEEMPIVENEPEDILELVPEEETSEEPEVAEEEPINVPLLSKAECKYRKSCYKTGKLVINDQKSTVKPPESVPHTEMEMTRANLRSKVDCKYRKSCYQDQHIGQQEDSQEVEEKEAEPEHETTDKIGAANTLHLSQQDKLACKYRESCYYTVGGAYIPTHHKNATTTFGNDSPAKESIRVVYDGNGPACNTYSSKYYLSCHPKLGIAPKEKAPIGPNGKKLCRKKKRNESDQ